MPRRVSLLVNLSRRTLLLAGAAAGASGLASPARAASVSPSFIDAYRTNTTANLTAETNAAVRILSGFQKVWSTGTAWNNGTVLDQAFLRANVRYVVTTTRNRTAAEAARSFVVDRQHQSYSVIAGLGPLADAYKAGALAVTGITAAPATTPATTVSDTIPAGAPAGSALGAGSPTSELGTIVTLVNTLRGNWSSGNPSKFAFQYPRPWRMTENGQVIDTGAIDAFGFPVYQSDVVVTPTLLRQRSTTPAEDGGYVSGHTNALFLAALAFAYAVPERFQEMITTAFDLAHTRIVTGMHSPADVIGGRILGTALAAAILNDPANATLKAEARAQASTYFKDLLPYARSGADRDTNARIVAPKFTYGLPSRRSNLRFEVPRGAEVLLETRLPYLDAAQRREVLRTTGLPAGNPILDGPEQWGHINLFAAADGYGAFDRTVAVSLDAAATGLAAADVWRNDIEGRGGLIKLGTGSLTLTGDNDYRGGTTVAGGTLVAASKSALGTGDLTVSGGTLHLTAAKTHVSGSARLSSGKLSLTVRPHGAPPLTVGGEAVIGSGTILEVAVAKNDKYDAPIPVLKARWVRGQFARVIVTTPGYRATLHHQGDTITVRLRKA
ncbi:phosphatase PAP2 family protein [Actinoplanes couchii]|uniref:phosphatase PAP2 family protein n=1 Tax=Actinoplanes couchii TaxID=403638 RepID=UPI001EF388F6|nr:phosphatase PAP2 family protein [Actinoplanes couchii]MDR6316307.1 autotransporter-associated beta strand protein [Actinoplanes couchii]